MCVYGGLARERKRYRIENEGGLWWWWLVGAGGREGCVCSCCIDWMEIGQILFTFDFGVFLVVFFCMYRRGRSVALLGVERGMR